MADVNFAKILEKLKEINEEFPDMRFGQVLQVAMDESKIQHNVNLNDRSSKSILKALSEFQDKHRIRRDKHGS